MTYLLSRAAAVLNNILFQSSASADLHCECAARSAKELFVIHASFDDGTCVVFFGGFDLRVTKEAAGAFYSEHIELSRSSFFSSSPPLFNKRDAQQLFFFFLFFFYSPRSQQTR